MLVATKCMRNVPPHPSCVSALPENTLIHTRSYTVFLSQACAAMNRAVVYTWSNERLFSMLRTLAAALAALVSSMTLLRRLMSHVLTTPRLRPITFAQTGILRPTGFRSPGLSGARPRAVRMKNGRVRATYSSCTCRRVTRRCNCLVAKRRGIRDPQRQI